VKSILNEFKLCDANKSGGLDKEEFRVLLAKVMDIKGKVPDGLLHSAWQALIRAGSGEAPGEGGGMVAWEASIDSFFQWYTGNMFSHVTLATQSKSDELVHRLARDHQVDATIIDKVKRRFDDFDTDGSGAIDFQEFLSMLCVLLRARNKDDLSEKRVFRFWKEIDRDSSGSVSFEEFAGWYLKYFNGADEKDAVSKLADPVGQFYQSFDPQVQRRNSVQKDVEERDAMEEMLEQINSFGVDKVPRKRGSI
jgi:Ca2+-binding EF-hand superfamily protein